MLNRCNWSGLRPTRPRSRKESIKERLSKRKGIESRRSDTDRNSGRKNKGTCERTPKKPQRRQEDTGNMMNGRRNNGTRKSSTKRGSGTSWPSEKE